MKRYSCDSIVFSSVYMVDDTLIDWIQVTSVRVAQFPSSQANHVTIWRIQSTWNIDQESLCARGNIMQEMILRIKCEMLLAGQSSFPAHMQTLSPLKWPHWLFSTWLFHVDVGWAGLLVEQSRLLEHKVILKCYIKCRLHLPGGLGQEQFYGKMRRKMISRRSWSVLWPDWL